MKVNAPEKIYIQPRTIEQLPHQSIVYTKPLADNSIEYTRTDAYIEKACQFIKEHHHEFSFWNTEEYELGFSTQKFIKDFKNYMGG